MIKHQKFEITAGDIPTIPIAAHGLAEWNGTGYHEIIFPRLKYDPSNYQLYFFWYAGQITKRESFGDSGFAIQRVPGYPSKYFFRVFGNKEYDNFIAWIVINRNILIPNNKFKSKNRIYWHEEGVQVGVPITKQIYRCFGVPTDNFVFVDTKNLNNIGSPVASEITGVYGFPNSIYWNAFVTTDNLNSGSYNIDYIVASKKIFSPIPL
jgi:hypothetical protein